MHRVHGLAAFLAAIVTCATAGAQPAPGANPQPPRIGVGAIGPAGLPADLRIRLEDAAATGLKASGADVVSAAALARARAGAALGGCADAVCDRRLAEITDTRYWLRGACQVDTSTYRLHLELVDARSGVVLVARDDTCDICTEADVAETANVAASALKAALGRTAAGSGATSGRPAPGTSIVDARVQAATGAVPVAPLLAARASSTAASAPRARIWRKALPWAALVTGAAVGAAGAYQLAINNDGSDCRGGAGGTCRLLNDTVWRWGVPLLAIGAALAVTGVVLLATAAGQEQHAAPQVSAVAPGSIPALAVSSQGLSLSGSF